MRPPANPSAPTTIVDVLRWRARVQPDRVAYIVLRDGEAEEARWTYADLDRRSQQIAAALRPRCRKGDRALLLYPSGLDFIAAFLGCLSAGAVAVPVATPRKPADLIRLAGLAVDAQPTVALTTGHLAERFRESARSAFGDTPLIGLDAQADATIADGRGAAETVDAVGPDDLALLQYTSGSTAAPKGVMVRHRQLMANEAAIARAFDHDEHTLVAGWLPFFHDMGLIGNVLQPLYAGVPCVLMAPLAFTQRPVRWLRAISRYRATTSGGPDFAYDLCVRKVSDEDKRTLDLSCWRVAFTGSEPVRAETLRRFTAAFAPCGFRESAWLPCYGLAEATLMVSGRARTLGATVLGLDRSALEAGRMAPAADAAAHAIVGCGPAVQETMLAIVDPVTLEPAPPATIGEIWIAGPGVADGYWRQAAASAATFGAMLPGVDGPWLRTGDLGFVRGDELFVAGRLKDLIIVRGRNYYPQDIELTVERAHPSLHAGGCAALAIEEEGEERLVIVQELAGRALTPPDEVCAAIRSAVSSDHDLDVHTIVLTSRGSVPRTTSGKTRRRACAELVRSGALPVLASWTRATAVAVGAETTGAAPEAVVRLYGIVAQALGVSAGELAADVPLVRCGLSSIRAVELLHALEEQCGVTIPLEELLDRITIRDLLERMEASHAGTASAHLEVDVSPARVEQAGDAFPLSINQASIYVLQRLSPDSAAYHIACAALIDRLSTTRLQEALQWLMCRHAALRSRIELRDGRPWQIVAGADETPLPWTEQVCSGATVDLLLPAARADAVQPFALDNAPLWRASLFHGGPEQPRLLLLTFHHLIADLWSLAIFWRELRASLSASAEAAEASDARVAMTSPGGVSGEYSAFVAAQAAFVSSERVEPCRQFWSRKLSGDRPVLALPLKAVRPAQQRHRGAREVKTLDPSAADRVIDVSQRSGVTPFTTLAAVFAVLLGRYTGQTDLLMGTPTAGREQAAFRETIGYFVNPIVLRADLSGAPTFAQVLDRVRRDLRQSIEHAAYPFAAVADLVQPRRSLDRAPLCDVMFVYQEALRGSESIDAFAAGVNGAPLSIGAGSIQPIFFDPGTSQRDLTLTVVRVDGRFVATAEYDTDLFDAWFIRALLGHYERLLDSCLTDPATRVTDATMLTAAEQRRLIERDEPLEIASARAACLHERFEVQVDRTPDAVAVSCDGGSLTYDAFNRRANQLARCLRALGAGPERLVAIDLERSLDLVTAILATLKSGAAYLPLDPAYPPERRAFMLADAKPQVVVTQAAHAEAALPAGAHRFCLDVERAALDAQDDRNLDVRAHPLNLAYVMYTSGSTGQPKGCMVAHHNVLRLLDRAPAPLRFGGSETWTLFHSTAFDFSVWEMWGAWLFGGRLVIVPQATCRAPEAFAHMLRCERVTVLSQTPTAFQSLLHELGHGAHAWLPDVRWVVFGGEALEFRRVRPWFGPDGESGAELINMYGITETTVHVTHRLVSAADAARAERSLIGSPWPDLHVRLLDAHLEPVPAGVRGEIVVGGAGVTRGYLQRPDLTAARFVPDPFSREPGARLYRSGDQARDTGSGDLEYLGRSDHQVQIHGHRVEPAEVEAALAGHPAVHQAVVLPQPVRAGWAFEADERPEPAMQVLAYRRYLKARPVERPALVQAASTEQQLVAYVVPQPDARPTVADLRAFLAERVPPYMRPAAFVLMERLPTTDSGKIHRGALPPPGRVRSDTETVPTAPRTRLERDLLGVWRVVLNADEVGIDDNFFTVGGDSIRAIQVVARAAEAGVPISVQDLFQHQTIRELAVAVARATPAGAQERQDTSAAAAPFAGLSASDRARLPGDVEEAYPLARMQAGLIYHSEQHPESPVYRASFLYRFTGDFHWPAFDAAARALVEQHAVLRTAFDLEHYSEPLQLVHRDIEPSVAVEDLRGRDAATQEQAIESWFARERRRGFDFTRPPLARVTVHRLSDSSFTVGLTCHDAILDGWSTALVLTELLQRYAAQRTGTPADQAAAACAYREFVSLERRDLASAECRAYWDRALDRCAITPMPVTPPADVDAAPRLGVVDVHLPRDLSDRVLWLARHVGVMPKHVLLAAHLRVLAVWTGADDVITGLEVNGRPERAGGERSVGQHLNTVPFRHRFARGSWLDLIRQIAAHEQALLPFRRYPYAEIQRQQGGRALYDTTFNYTHFHVFLELQHLPALRVTAGYGRELTHYTLKTEFNQDVFTDRLHLDVIFNASRMVESQARAIAWSYVQVLRAMVDAPTTGHETAAVVRPEDHSWLAAHAAGPQIVRDPMTLMRLCEQQRDRAPGHTAVEYEGQTLTYVELHARANQLARHLRTLGVGAETTVGVHLERSFDLVIALLAVLKAGGAYVPLDPDSPSGRLRLMAAEARAHVVLTRAATREAVTAPVVLAVDADDRPWEACGTGDVDEAVSDPRHAVSVLFTSGSTGQPKGVVNTHSGLCNRLQWMQEAYPLDTSDRVLQKTPIGFDVSGWELFWPLMTGAAMVLARPGGQNDPAYLAETIQRARATTVHFVPSMLRVFLDEPPAGRCTSLRRIICSGEALAPDLVEKCYARLPCDLHNLYGPTEAAIDVTAWPCPRHDVSSPIPIGRPIANTQAFVLDRRLLPCPAGAVGELYLAGVNLARGYVQRPDLTAASFVPCVWPGTPDGERMYRTGDRVRLRADGALEFLGRVDSQMKVNGVRIEPAEIEALLAQHPACVEAAVAACPDVHGRLQLVAHIVSRDGAAWAGVDLRAWLAARLPAAMVPSRYVPIAVLPRTSSGKIDRRRLPAPPLQQAEADETVAGEEIAEILRRIEALTDEDVRALLTNTAHE